MTVRPKHAGGVRDHSCISPSPGEQNEPSIPQRHCRRGDPRGPGRTRRKYSTSRWSRDSTCGCAQSLGPIELDASGWLAISHSRSSVRSGRLACLAALALGSSSSVGGERTVDHRVAFSNPICWFQRPATDLRWGCRCHGGDSADGSKSRLVAAPAPIRPAPISQGPNRRDTGPGRRPAVMRMRSTPASHRSAPWALMCRQPATSEARHRRNCRL